MEEEGKKEGWGRNGGVAMKYAYSASQNIISSRERERQRRSETKKDQAEREEDRKDSAPAHPQIITAERDTDVAGESNTQQRERNIKKI